MNFCSSLLASEICDEIISDAKWELISTQTICISHNIAHCFWIESVAVRIDLPVGKYPNSLINCNACVCVVYYCKLNATRQAATLRTTLIATKFRARGNSTRELLHIICMRKYSRMDLETRGSTTPYFDRPLHCYCCRETFRQQTSSVPTS